MDSTTQPSIAVIVSLLRDAGGQLLGSQLGAKLCQIYPEWAENPSRKPLKLIIADEGANEISWKVNPGSDSLFQLKDSISEEAAWSLFKNPNLKGNLYVSDDNELKTSAEDRPEKQGKAVERFSNIDQQKLIREFLESKIPENLLPSFAGLVVEDNENYWRDFLGPLKRTGLLPTWIQFRFARLREILQQRVEGTGVERSVAIDIVDKAISNDSNNVVKRKPEIRNTVLPSYAPPSTKFQSIQDLASAIVLEMSSDQLSDLELPLGKIWNVLSRR